MEEKIDNALYVVATPIGNLGDITTRALHVLTNVDVVAAEDTRNTQSLLMHYGIKANLIAVHQHNERNAADGIAKLLSEGKSVALVTDAGTPAVSDPGARVVAAIHAANHRVIPIPGASAVIAAISASGEGEDGFLFCGFLSAKAGERKRRLEELQSTDIALVFYESPHRILESVAAMAEIFGDTRTLIICRELTKKFETIHRVKLSEAMKWFEADSNQQRGEFVLVLSKPSVDAANEAKTAEDALLAKTLQVLLSELPVKQAVALAVQLTGEKKNKVYDLALQLKDPPL
jgi:16S rRNA (cytidine1402-2'-O)-methyltransferase